jgi:hypothetical protein
MLLLYHIGSQQSDYKAKRSNRMNKSITIPIDMEINSSLFLLLRNSNTKSSTGSETIIKIRNMKKAVITRFIKLEI